MLGLSRVLDAIPVPYRCRLDGHYALITLGLLARA
jgi:hypothetical protein